MSETIKTDREIKKYISLFSIFESDSVGKRIEVISKLVKEKGIDIVLNLACSVSDPESVGNALAKINNREFDKLLPKMLLRKDRKLIQLANGYIKTSYNQNGWDWVDKIRKDSWTKEQKCFFLKCLPFEGKAWNLAKEFLGQNEKDYWRHIQVIPHGMLDFQPAIEKLVEAKRHNAALGLYYHMLNYDKLDFALSSDLIINTLLTNTNSIFSGLSVYNNLIFELIERLRSDDEVDREYILKIEWAYLPIFTGRKKEPSEIEKQLATDPKFFCQVVKLVCGCNNGELMNQGLKSNNKIQHIHAEYTLRNWNFIPGAGIEDFSPREFKNWLQKVKNYEFDEICLEKALNTVGNLLRKTPSDEENGLWINHEIAKMLDENDALLDGYMNGEMDTLMIPDPALERKLANDACKKAKEIMNKGYKKFAGILIEIADFHKQRAKKGQS